MVGTVNMSTNRQTDAAIVNIKGTDRALAMVWTAMRVMCTPIRRLAP